MDYCMPRAGDFCSFALASNPVPAKTNILGIKGLEKPALLAPYRQL